MTAFCCKNASTPAHAAVASPAAICPSFLTSMTPPGIRWKRSITSSPAGALSIGSAPDSAWPDSRFPRTSSSPRVSARITHASKNGGALYASSTAEWIEKLTQLIRDAALRREMGTRGRARFEQHYTAEAVARTLATRMRELAAPRS